MAVQLSPWWYIYFHDNIRFFPIILSMFSIVDLSTQFPWQPQNRQDQTQHNIVSIANICFYGNVCFVSIYACQYHWFFSLFFVSFCPWQPHILISNIKLPFITPMFTIATPTTPWHPLLHDNSNCLHDNMVSPIATPTSLWPPTQASNSHTHSKYLLLWWHILYQW